MSKYLKIVTGKELSLTLALTLVAIIFSASALFLPWWSINMSPEASSILNSNMKTDYYLSQTVSAVMQSKETTENQSVPLNGLTGSQGSSGDLSAWLSSTYIITLVGLALSCLMLILIVLPILGRTSNRYLPLSGYIAAILLFVAPIMLASGFPASVSKLSSLTPISLPSAWTPINPVDIKGFWGSTQILSNPEFAAWASDGNFWIWGADAGWYLAFAASLLLAVSSLLTRTITKKKVVVG
jgi:hypothetical protein